MIRDDETTMGPSAPDPADTTCDDDLIDRLYEVAVDPTRYEALLDRWEEMIAPRRATANENKIPVLQMETFVGHFRRADTVLNDVLGGTSGEATDAAYLLGQIDRAAGFAVDRSLNVTHVNAAASLSLGVTRGAPVCSLALGPGEAEVLSRQIHRLLIGNTGEPTLVRVRSDRADRMILMHLRLVRPETEPGFVIALASELGWPAGFTDMLRGAFDLSPAEGEVIRALAEGAPLADIATARGRSIATIRAQIKSIMSKTETRSQAELVRLTLSTMEMAQFTDDSATTLPMSSEGFGTLAPRPFRTFILPDGRRLDYLVLGDPDGKPCLFLPLDYGLVRWPAPAEDEATRRGMKIVVPVRPGYGRSTPLAKGTAYIPQVTDDLVALMDHLDMGRVPIVSLGGDSYYAFALHAAYPERVAALICAAGVLPFNRPEQYERMDKWHRFILAGARYTPHLLPFMVKAGFALAHRLGKRGFIHAVYGKSGADVATFEIPEVFEAMVCGSEVCLSDKHSAHDAFAREIIAHETSDWTVELAALRVAQQAGQVAVHFFNGMQDPQVPPGTIEEFRSDYPWVEFNLFPDAGQLLFFLKWREVIACTERYL